MREPQIEGKMQPVKPSVRFRSAALVDSVISNGSATPNDSIASVDSFVLPETDGFSLDGYADARYQSMTEKGIRRLCAELLDLKKVSAEEMQRNVYANYTAFIRTSQEVSGLEAELMTMQSFISTQAALVQDLLGVCLQSSSNITLVPASQDVLNFEEDPEPTQLEIRIQSLSDALDVLLAEQRVDEALAALDEEESVISYLVQENSADASLILVQSALAERKSCLIEQLAEAAQRPFIHTNELRKVVSALNRLGDGSRAHTLLLNSYRVRCKNSVEYLHPICTWYTGAYTTSLARVYFSTILQASRDSVSIFGDVPAFSSEFVLWARRETEDYAALVKKHILSFSAVTGGLRAALDTVEISVGHCSLLEQEGIALCPLLLRLLKPCVEAAMEATWRFIEETVCSVIVTDNWNLNLSPNMLVANRVSYSMTLKLSISAHRLNSMIQDLLEDMTPLMCKHFGGSALDGIAHLFSKYIEMLTHALSGPTENEGKTGLKNGVNVRMAVTEAQQLALLGNATALADELLPRAAVIISSLQQANSKEETRRRAGERPATGVTRLPEQKEWRRNLQQSVDRLRDHICRHYALELIYSSDAEPLVTADLYLNMHENDKEQIWHKDTMPSPPFQALFLKLSKLALVAADVLPGRERLVILLLMRLTETVMMWLLDDQDFWGDIEGGPVTLGSTGLQQFVLDMHFVNQVASYGRYSSRQMRQAISTMISRVVDVFAATGLDPNSVLPKDEWFEDTSKEAILKLVDEMSRSNSVSNERDPDSPVSISSYSMHSGQGSP
eukprot:c27639_g1_i1 orf=288-2651(+)